MNITLWIVQIVLAIVFLWHGTLFLAPPAELVETMNAQIAPWLRTLIGVAEVLAAVGLILPSATRTLPKLTPLAAAGLMLVTLCAAGLHILRGEVATAIMPAVLFVLAALVAYGRGRARPIAPRTARNPQRSMGVM
jgi:uncharacterized membrane protein YphA (DoxX/SURF4 family)